MKRILLLLLLLPCSLLAQENIPLDGEWSFWIPESPESSSLDPGVFKKQPVTVPHTYNVMEGLDNYAGKACYSRLLPISPAMSGRLVRLHFNGVFHSAIVYVNGRKAGEHLHAGYTPFSFDITPYLDFSPGARNELRVECDNGFTPENLPYNGRNDWANDGGIYRSVSLLLSGARSIRYVHVNPAINLTDSTARARFDIRLWQEDVSKADFSLMVTENRTGRIVHESQKTLKAGPGGIFSYEVDCSRVELWHFDNPALYTFEVRLADGRSLSDIRRERFGFRTVTLDGERLLLNGEPVRLPGIENMPGSNPDYGMAEDRAYMEKTMRRMKDLNCTITRFHWAQDGYRFDLMDEMGMLSQEELCWWQGPAKTLGPLMGTAKRQIEEMVEAHYNHPSIYCWGMSNEVDENTADIIELGRFTRSLDPNRLLNSMGNSFYKTLENEPSLALDIPTWNEYMGTWHGEKREDLLTSMPEVAKVLNGRPLLITEHGLCEPAFTGGDVRRIDEMIFHITEWKKHPFIIGYIYFSLEDYRSHAGQAGFGKGIIRRHGVCNKYLEPKPSYYVLQQLMSPVIVTGVRTARRHPGGTWQEMDQVPRSVDITLKVSNDIPSYTIRGYKLRYMTKKGTLRTLSLPDLAPDQEYLLTLPEMNDDIAFEIIRADESRVMRYY